MIEAVRGWAARRRDIRALLLVGSHARGDARPDSDIDFVLLCHDPASCLRRTNWIAAFGDVARFAVEDWGKVRSLRVFYRDGTEVEFGIAGLEWAALPPDPGTREVLREGGSILLDRDGLLEGVTQAVRGRQAASSTRSSLTTADDVSEAKRILPPTYFLAAAAAMGVLHLVAGALRLWGAPWRYLGMIPMAAGIVLNLWSDNLFKRAGTEVKPFRPSSALVVTGPYRFTRNPMYLGLVLILAGLAILLGSALPLAVPPLMLWLFTTRFITGEERDMERQFGTSYSDYRERVRRWL
jgi:protein-S-isoprenylcysteine O-methyltransferase Ste14/predicted nucleotidyltransferase